LVAAERNTAASPFGPIATATGPSTRPRFLGDTAIAQLALGRRSHLPARREA
jgi:hypothetical protein